MKQLGSRLVLAVSVAALAACSAVGGGSLVPNGDHGRTPSLRAIPVKTPSPMPQPSAPPQNPT